MTGQQWSDTIVDVVAIAGFFTVILAFMGALPWQRGRKRK